MSLSSSNTQKDGGLVTKHDWIEYRQSLENLRRRDLMTGRLYNPDVFLSSEEEDRTVAGQIQVTESLEFLSTTTAQHVSHFDESASQIATLAELTATRRELETVESVLQLYSKNILPWRTWMNAQTRWEFNCHPVTPAGRRLSVLRQKERALSSFGQSLECYGAALRRRFNHLARPSLPNRHLLDLPNEILIQIAEHFQPGPLFSDFQNQRVAQPDAETKGIQHLRLTCKKLCEASSHLLLHSISISLVPSSIQRLCEISQHPLIRQGVRTVRLHLDLYCPFKAEYWKYFALCIMPWIFEDIDTLENVHDCGVEEYFSPGLFGDMVEDTEPPDNVEAAGPGKYSHLRATLTAARQTCGGILIYDVNPDHVAALKRALAEYVRRFEEQRKLVKDEQLLQTVTTAISLMPRARGLRIFDEAVPQDFYTFARPDAGLDDVFRHYVRGYTWAKASQEWDTHPPIGFLKKLPIMLHEAGKPLDSLGIEVTPPKLTGAFLVGPGTAPALRLAAQRLKTFHFRLMSGYTMDHPQRCGPVFSFLEPFTKSEALERLCISLGPVRSVGSSAIPGPLPALPRRPWSHLRHVELVNVPLDIPWIQGLVHVPHRIHISLHGPYLITGRWQDVLDILRNKVLEGSSISSPSGSHDQNNLLHLMHFIFDKWRTGISPCQEYLLGITDVNPFIEHGSQAELTYLNSFVW
ncbi:hypothetical protein F4780DRAFT_752299 [Xylariomycetidae sp. FL0641]|nr:hypothetical protein F4780DRAFT_752299 [Xylariomycetidae sp. FL0641]